MADEITTSKELLVDFLFMDGDTRRQTMKNPKTTISQSEITALDTLILNGGTSTLLLGDRTLSPFRRINQVTKRTTLSVKLDITPT